jgi:hypothetical protein
MLANPIKRIVLSSTSSNIIIKFRQRFGAIKGRIPSITSIKQNAIASSCNMLRTPLAGLANNIFQERSPKEPEPHNATQVHFLDREYFLALVASFSHGATTLITAVE